MFSEGPPRLKVFLRKSAYGISQMQGSHCLGCRPIPDPFMPSLYFYDYSGMVWFIGVRMGQPKDEVKVRTVSSAFSLLPKIWE